MHNKINIILYKQELEEECNNDKCVIRAKSMISMEQNIQGVSKKR